MAVYRTIKACVGSGSYQATHIHIWQLLTLHGAYGFCRVSERKPCQHCLLLNVFTGLWPHCWLMDCQ